VLPTKKDAILLKLMIMAWVDLTAIQTVERLTLGEEAEASSTSGKKEVSGLPRSK